MVLQLPHVPTLKEVSTGKLREDGKDVVKENNALYVPYENEFVSLLNLYVGVPCWQKTCKSVQSHKT